MVHLNKGLVGHWTMDDDDTSGGTLYDRSASDAHATLSGDINTGVDGRVGEAYTFDGVDDELTIPLTPSLTITDTVSVCGWIKTPNANSPEDGNAMPFHECQDGSNRGWRLGVEGGVAEWGIYDGDEGGGATELNGTVTLDDDIWHFMVGTFDGSTMRVYIDGVEDVNTVKSGLAPPNRDPTIGVRSPGIGHFGGEIGDVRVYNRALSADEISRLYEIRSKRSHGVNPNASGPKVGDATNLMDWADWAVGNSDNFGNWNANGETGENDVIAERHPYDEARPVWYGRSESTNSNGDGGWDYNVPVSEIDNSKKYRYTVWAKQEYTSGTVYHGTDSNNGNIEDFAGNVQNNPYFWSGNLPRQNEWFLIAGYIHPAGASSASESEIYDLSGNTYSDVKNMTDYRWVSSLSNSCQNRSYYYYDTNVGRGAYFADPRFEAMDGSERNLSDILNRGAYRDRLKKGLVGNFLVGNNNVSGGNLLDKSEQKNDATGSGTPVTASGNLFQSLDADGTGTVSWDSQAFRNAVQSGEWTITLWINQYVHTDAYDWRDLIQWGATSQRFERGNANGSTDQDYWCNLGNSANQLSVNSAGVADSTWWHCAIRVSQKENVFEMYVNGSVNQSTSASDFVDPGVISINPHDYGGYVEDLRFYTRALSQEEIAELYNRA